jgi:hypothetical protein
MIQAKLRSTASHVAPMVRATLASAALEHDEALREGEAADDLD